MLLLHCALVVRLRHVFRSTVYVLLADDVPNAASTLSVAPDSVLSSANFRFGSLLTAVCCWCRGQSCCVGDFAHGYAHVAVFDALTVRPLSDKAAAGADGSENNALSFLRQTHAVPKALLTQRCVGARGLL